MPSEEKLANRPYKETLKLPRGDAKDGLAGLVPTFDWSYIPYGQYLRDPLLSPHFAASENLPPFVGVVAAELDLLAHESWRLACRLAREGGLAHGDATAAARYEVPDPKSEEIRTRVCGSQVVRSQPGRLEVVDRAGKQDERFAFEENWEGGGVKWLLVPDALHGFDNKHVRELMGGAEAIEDGEEKTEAVMQELGAWLKWRVWGL